MEGLYTSGLIHRVKFENRQFKIHDISDKLILTISCNTIVLPYTPFRSGLQIHNHQTCITWNGRAYNTHYFERKEIVEDNNRSVSMGGSHLEWSLSSFERSPLNSFTYFLIDTTLLFVFIFVPCQYREDSGLKVT